MYISGYVNYPRVVTRIANTTFLVVFIPHIVAETEKLDLIRCVSIRVCFIII